MPISDVTSKLCMDLADLSFGPPIAMVYNPLEYARLAYDTYVERYGGRPKEIVLVGMNPGPWGMTQTGVPFGEVNFVRDWLGIEEEIIPPARMHPKRPVEGFSCQRSEVSGRRLWGWAQQRFGTPEIFFRRFFVLNYCPLVFLEESGRNRTPDTLPVAERRQLFDICDQALRQSIERLQPRLVIGVGRFAANRATEALAGCDLSIGQITHPSPANPRANRGWAACIEAELTTMGVKI